MTGAVDALVTPAWIAFAVAATYRAQAAIGRRPSRLAVAAATVCASVVAGVTIGAAGPSAMPRALVGSALVIAAFADARTGLLFDAITLPTAITAALADVLSGGTREGSLGVLLLVGTFGTIVACSRGRLMGLGDVKAMYAIGAAFGPFDSVVAVFAACLSGIASAALAGSLRPSREIRFGPHLAAGAFFASIAAAPIKDGMFGS